MRIYKLILVCSILLGYQNMAHAGFMLEPWVGYEMGKLKCTEADGDDCGGDSKGMNYGGRIGYKMPLGVWFAGEIAGSSGMTATQPAPDPDVDVDHQSVGVTVGWDLLLGLRLFAGYNFLEKIEVKDATSKTSFYGGSSTKFGVGYKFPLLPLALNLEMWSATYKKLESDGIKYDIDTIFSTFKHTAYIVSVSAPFDF